MSDHGDPTTASCHGSAEEERDYMLGRADAHGQLAEKARGGASRSIHLTLRDLYAERARRMAWVIGTNEQEQ